MLTNTFCHLPGVGETKERGLWSAGVTCWDSTVDHARVRLPRALRGTWDQHVQDSRANYAQQNIGYFAEHLPAGQHWRLYRDFRHSCAFVDIETTGLDCWSGEITTIVLYDGQSVRYYVNGDNLPDFPGDVANYRLLVTYNGKCFDVPFIEHFFGIRLGQAHIDLRYPLRSLGLSGGLKGCERQVGIARPGLENVDGFLAVLLWNEYRRRGNSKALETLLAYNAQDTLSLHLLMVHAYNRKVQATPFAATLSLPAPALPAPRYQADEKVVGSVMRHAFGQGLRVG